jgi:hypothetical protein
LRKFRIVSSLNLARKYILLYISVTILAFLIALTLLGYITSNNIELQIIQAFEHGYSLFSNASAGRKILGIFIYMLSTGIWLWEYIENNGG